MRKIFDNIVPILLVAMISSMGFLVVQVMSIRAEMASFRVNDFAGEAIADKNVALLSQSVGTLQTAVDDLQHAVNMLQQTVSSMTGKPVSN